MIENYGNDTIEFDEFKKIQNIFEDTGALLFAKQKVEEYSRLAKKYIPSITRDEEFQDLLFELIDFLTKRSV